jgi:SAM-dependent methyltransferase
MKTVDEEALEAFTMIFSSYAMEWMFTSEGIEKRGIYDRISNYANIQPSHNVLELGCGNGKNLARVCKITDSRNVVVGIDENFYLLGLAKENLESSGKKVNMQLLADKAEVKSGEVSLIIDDYETSKFPYLSKHEFDKTLLTFLGGAPLHRESGTKDKIWIVLDNVENVMRKNGEFIYVERFENKEFAKSIAESISDGSKNFKLSDFTFQESFDDYKATFFPGSISTVLTIGGNSGPNLSEREMLEKTMKSIGIKEPQFGIAYMKFKKI